MRQPGRLVAALTASLALLSAGCGKSKEEKLFDSRRDACLGAMGDTVQQLTDLVGPPTPLFCDTPANVSPYPSDVCPGGPAGQYTENVCEYGWVWIANDPSLCSAISCRYVCLARVTEAQQLAVGTAASICATVFVSGQ